MLLDNLQFYFSTAVSRIMHGLCMNVQWGTLESVALWQAKYEYYVDSLGKSPCPLTVGDVFSGEARGGSRLLWG